MLKSRLLRAGVGAIIIAIALGSAGAGAYRISQSGDPDLRYPGLWVGTVPPYNQQQHVVRWCWDGTGASWVSRTDITEAATAWNNAVGAWAFFEDGGNCTGSNSTCDAGDPTDGKWRIYVRHDGIGSNISAAKTCPNFSGQSGTGTGQITEEDMYVNEDYVAAFDASIREQAENVVILHEMGHMLGLDHPCGDPAAAGSNDYGCDGNYADCNAASGLSLMCEFGTTKNCFYPSNLSACQSPRNDDINGVKAIYRDADGDGCVGHEERGADPVWGGDRSDNKTVDFPDWNGDRVIDNNDALVAMGHFGHDHNQDAADAKWDMNGTSADSDYPWRTVLPENGQIDLNEVLFVLALFGHTCDAGP